MADQHNFIAIDLGATSGRTIVGQIIEGKIEMKEISRFKNSFIELQGHFYWDILHLYNEIIKGLKEAAKLNITFESIGIDTWGVDFVLFDQQGKLMRFPYSYRDPYTIEAMEKYFSLVDKEKVYEISGIQFLNFNSLFQLAAMRFANDSALDNVDKFLFLPDALSYLLTGKMITERTILSTSAFMDAKSGDISNELLEPLKLDKSYFAPIVQPGYTIGNLTEEIQRQTGLKNVPVIAVAGHDTASAVASVPAEDANFAYLSSGTWSLMGIETSAPIISSETYKMNFTNEGGIENTTRFLKNICGMWILECCRKEWTNFPEKYDELYKETEKTEGFRCFIYPDAPEFANPKSMVDAIKEFCKRTGQFIPQTYQEQARCIFDSLAMRYRQVFELLKTVSPFEIKRLHIIGGGTQNYLLNQWTANAIGVDVLTGPIEATAIGNIMIQAKGAGLTESLNDMRKIIKNSIQPNVYAPTDSEKWSNAYKRYLDVIDIYQKTK